MFKCLHKVGVLKTWMPDLKRLGENTMDATKLLLSIKLHKVKTKCYLYLTGNDKKYFNNS